MAESAAVFRLRIGRLTNSAQTFTTSSAGDAGGVTLVSTALLDHFIGNDMGVGRYFYHTTADEWRRATDFDLSTSKVTVSRTFTTDPVANSVAFEMYRNFNPDEIDNAVTAALEESYPYIATKVVDETLTGVADTYTYTIPSNILELNRLMGAKVSFVINTGTASYPYRRVNRWIVRGTTLQIFELIPAGRTIRLEGTDVALLSEINDVTTLRLLAYKTAEILYRAAAQPTNEDHVFAAAQAEKFETLFDAKKDVWGILVDTSQLDDLRIGVSGGGEIAENNTPSA